jgi:hypothetical protein
MPTGAGRSPPLPPATRSTAWDSYAGVDTFREEKYAKGDDGVPSQKDLDRVVEQAAPG